MLILAWCAQRCKASFLTAGVGRGFWRRFRKPKRDLSNERATRSREPLSALGFGETDGDGTERMARKNIFVSVSGEAIPEGKGAKIRITFHDARKGSTELDVTDAEGKELARKGRKTARRGRKPRATDSTE
jgi:hypothetical protein